MLRNRTGKLIAYTKGKKITFRCVLSQILVHYTRGDLEDPVVNPVGRATHELLQQSGLRIQRI
ncbi:hypothetical protein M407DRAFT_246461, partial [Tulasnella calospora MUT 4182]